MNSVAVIIGSAKTDLVPFRWGFGEELLKDKFAFLKAYKNNFPEWGENCLQNANFYKLCKACKLDRVSFSTPEMMQSS